MAGVKPSAISSATVAAFKTKLGYLTQEEADLRYPQISEGEPVDLDALLAAKADLASPTFTGTPLVPTAAAGTNTTQAASTAFVKTEISQTAGKKIFSSNTQITNTGNTTENTVITFTIPAGTLGPNGSLHFICLYSFTTSTNLKEFKVKIGSNTIGYWSTSSAGLSAREYYTLNNRNSLISQVSSPGTTASGGTFNQSPQSQAISTYAINFGVDQTCTVTIKNGLGTDTLAVEAFECIAYY